MPNRGSSSGSTFSASTTGTGGIGHLGTASLATLAGLRFNYVPYKGTGPALTAALANEVHFTMVTIGTSLPYARNGRLRALGVSSLKRSPELPDVPAIGETVENEGWRFEVVDMDARRIDKVLASKLTAAAEDTTQE